MFRWPARVLIAILFVLTPFSLLHGQFSDLAQKDQIAPSSVPIAVPDWLPIRIPASLYERWRKYGIWDYKEGGYQYRESTKFNFGATGGAAGFDRNSLIALAQASKPTPEDVKKLDDPELLANFDRNFDGFEQLRAMTEQDNHLIRIANDFTWLDTSSKWPRADIGLITERWDEYRALFAKLSLPEGIVRTADFPGTIFFVARARGLCTGGSSAGYAYSTSALSPTTQSPAKDLDEEARKNPKQYYAYLFRPLKPNWYAFYEVDW